MNNTLRWDDIKRPDKDYNVRKVPEKCSLPLYIGKDRDGRCIFLLALEGDQSSYFRAHSVTLFGIGVDLRLDGGVQKLILVLEKHIDRDLFDSLCLSLISVLKDVEDSAVGLSVTLAHLKRWKAFLSGRKAKILTPEEVRGLFGELHFLEVLLEEREIDQNKILSAWVGPEDSHQDYILSNTAIEIKTLSGKERNSVRISSEDQLEGLADRLYLKIFRLGEHPDDQDACSLNNQVKTIENLLTDTDAIESFTRKLSSVGYLPLEDYDDPNFMILSETTYLVSDDFPRLIRSALPEGVLKVGYDLALPNLEQFVCGNKIDWGN